MMDIIKLLADEVSMASINIDEQLSIARGVMTDEAGTLAALRRTPVTPQEDEAFEELVSVTRQAPTVEDHLDRHTGMPWHALSDDELYQAYAEDPDPLVRELCRRLPRNGPRG